MKKTEQVTKFLPVLMMFYLLLPGQKKNIIMLYQKYFLYASSNTKKLEAPGDVYETLLWEDLDLKGYDNEGQNKLHAADFLNCEIFN